MNTSRSLRSANENVIPSFYHVDARPILKLIYIAIAIRTVASRCILRSNCCLVTLGRRIQTHRLLFFRSDPYYDVK